MDARTRLDLFVRDFREAFKRRAHRLAHPAGTLVLSGLSVDGTVPVMTTFADLVTAAGTIATGETQAVAGGLPSMANPSPAEVAAELAAARLQAADVPTADLAYDAAQTAIAARREEANLLAEDVMADLKSEFRRLDGPGLRRVQRAYGATFASLPGGAGGWRRGNDATRRCHRRDHWGSGWAELSERSSPVSATLIRPLPVRRHYFSYLYPLTIMKLSRISLFAAFAAYSSALAATPQEEARFIADATAALNTGDAKAFLNLHYLEGVPARAKQATSDSLVYIMDSPVSRIVLADPEPKEQAEVEVKGEIWRFVLPVTKMLRVEFKSAPGEYNKLNIPVGEKDAKLFITRAPAN